MRAELAARGVDDLAAAAGDARDVAAVAAAAAVGETMIGVRAADPAGPTTLLVDHWYSHAVGHVIEALRRCQGYHACDPALRLGLVLNGASPAELARCAPFVAEVFAVPYTGFGTRRRATRGARSAASRATGTTSSTIRPRPTPTSSGSRACAATTRRRGGTFAPGSQSASRARRRRPTSRTSSSGSTLPDDERARAREELWTGAGRSR